MTDTERIYRLESAIIAFVRCQEAEAEFYAYAPEKPTAETSAEYRRLKEQAAAAREAMVALLPAFAEEVRAAGDRREAHYERKRVERQAEWNRQHTFYGDGK